MMDYSNERYVRVYTRDTVTWKLLDWRARTLLLHLLRKVDRSGVLDIGDEGLPGVAAIVELPIEIVEAGMPQLVARGTIVAHGTCITAPNFLAAQEAPQSDKLRAAEYRARRRDAALGTAGTTSGTATKRDATATKRDATITDRDGTVTHRHAASLQPPRPASQARPEEDQSSLRAHRSAGVSPPAGGGTDAEIRKLCDELVEAGGDPDIELRKYDAEVPRYSRAKWLLDAISHAKKHPPKKPKKPKKRASAKPTLVEVDDEELVPPIPSHYPSAVRSVLSDIDAGERCPDGWWAIPATESIEAATAPMWHCFAGTDYDGDRPEDLVRSCTVDGSGVSTFVCGRHAVALMTDGAKKRWPYRTQPVQLGPCQRGAT